MKTSEALLELAYKVSKSGAMSADQALALLRRVEWGDERYGAGDAMPTVEERVELVAAGLMTAQSLDEPAARDGYAPGEEVGADKPAKPE